MAVDAGPYKFGYALKGNIDKPVVLFLHGFLGNKDDWRGISNSLNSDFATLAVDLPGHGETTVADVSLYRMENCAAGLVEFIDQLGIRKCHCAGYSMGGRLALYLAVNFPERFASIVIESASPGLKTPEERAARIEHDAELIDRLETGDFHQFLTDWYSQPIFASLSEHEERFAQLFRQRMDNHPPGLALSLRMMGTGVQPSLWHRLDEIEVPILSMVGELDLKYVGIANEMSLLCRRMERRIISDSGHNTHFEKPREYTEFVRKFLMKNT